MLAVCYDRGVDWYAGSVWSLVCRVWRQVTVGKPDEETKCQHLWKHNKP